MKSSNFIGYIIEAIFIFKKMSKISLNLLLNNYFKSFKFIQSAISLVKRFIVCFNTFQIFKNFWLNLYLKNCKINYINTQASTHVT
jgi:hypothetical protein